MKDMFVHNLIFSKNLLYNFTFQIQRKAGDIWTSWFEVGNPYRGIVGLTQYIFGGSMSRSRKGYERRGGGLNKFGC